MSKGLLQRILQHYGYTTLVVAPPQKGYRNESHQITLPDGRQLNLILYKREPGMAKRITNANRVGNFLADKEFPARQTADERVICLRMGSPDPPSLLLTPLSFPRTRESSQRRNSLITGSRVKPGMTKSECGLAGSFVKYGALYTYLPGKTIPWEAYSMEHIKQLGATMSNMHAALQALPKGNLRPAATEYYTVCARMYLYFTDTAVAKALQAKLGLTVSQKRLNRLEELLIYCGLLPGQQPLHMDFVRGNILFAEEGEPRITGILDFEKTAWGHPVFDIARTLAFLLVDCKYKDEAKVRKYFLHSGYNKRGQNSFQNWQLLEELVDLFLLYDFYKFLRHNPYEYLEQNEHFVRTRDFLLKRNLIRMLK